MKAPVTIIPEESFPGLCFRDMTPGKNLELQSDFDHRIDLAELFGRPGKAARLSIHRAKIRAVQDVFCAGIFFQFFENSEGRLIFAARIAVIATELKGVTEQAMDTCGLQPDSELFASIRIDSSC